MQRRRRFYCRERLADLHIRKDIPMMKVIVCLGLPAILVAFMTAF